MGEEQRERKRERVRKRKFQAGSTVLVTEHDVGFELTNQDIIT